MKNLFTLSLVLILGGLFSHLSAAEYELMPTIGKKFSDDDRLVEDDQPFYGVRASAYVNEKSAVQLGFETSSDNKMSDGGKTDKERYSLHALYEPLGKSSAKALRPYFLGGLGYDRIHREIPGVSSQMFLDAGAGVRVRMSPRVDLVTEARLVHGMEDSDDDLVGTVGLGIKLGATKPCACRKKAIPIATMPVSEAEMAKLSHPKGWSEKAKVAPLKPADVKEEAVAPKEECPTVPEIKSGYYVQVIALRSYSADPVVKRLQRAHIPFTLKADRGMTKVLAGPYATRQAARRALGRIRHIRRDAFITHI